MTRIFIIGLAGGGEVGAYEKQLGNVAILIPTINLLKTYIPDAQISTTIQLTDNFCIAHGITRIPDVKLLPRYDSARKALISLFDLCRVSLWRVFKCLFRVKMNFLVHGKKLQRFTHSDVVLDLNGDIFPSDIRNPARLLSGVADVLTIRQLGIPVVEFVSSPGPFNTRFTRFVSKIMFNRISVVINRDPISSELLRQIGIKRTPIVNTACPAFLLESDSSEKAKQSIFMEGININKRSLIGITLCGYNLISQRTWGTLSDFSDLQLFIPMVKYLLEELNATVFLLPHVYRVNPYISTYEYINGPDYDICLHLYRMVDGDKYNGKLRLIEGKYTPSEAKSIIGQCDMYISGRFHAGVAALSQCIPTVLIAYGHKHKGMAKLLHQEKYVFEGMDPERLKLIVKNAWESREEITKVIRDRMVRIKKLVNLNFEIVKEIVDLNKSERDHIPKEKANKWASMGEKSLMI